MTNRENQGRQKGRQKNEDQSTGNKQRTAQTGGQNNGGESPHPRDDRFTEDLRRSGDRKSRE